MNHPPAISQALSHDPDTVAIVDEQGSHSYGTILERSACVAAALLRGEADLAGKRVAFLMPPDSGYAAVLWGIWRAGGIAVPLCAQHPAAEMQYVIEDSGADFIVAHPEFEATLRPLAETLGRNFVLAEPPRGATPSTLPDVPADRGALIVYTSGTTSRPKGALSLHRNLAAQVTSLVEAWGWTSQDRTALILPLHHVHGIVNVVCCALWSGAECEMLRHFDAEVVWNRLSGGHLTLFMAVPTIYNRLIAAWEKAPESQRKTWSAGCARLRLMVSGSAALPVPVFNRWKEISGHPLLERYGMTEIGMALSNPLHGERRPGHVGAPLPGVEVRLIDETGKIIQEEETPGEIQVRGDTIFKEYWGKPKITAETFSGDGWFRTGDIAVLSQGSYRILGRNSVDIIKTGGYKVSALEVEEVLLTHPAILEVAVIGVADVEWGERVAAATVLRSGKQLELGELRAWCKELMAIYKIPSLLRIVDSLPRNAMGKVVKPSVKDLFVQVPA